MIPHILYLILFFNLGYLTSVIKSDSSPMNNVTAHNNRSGRWYGNDFSQPGEQSSPKNIYFPIEESEEDLSHKDGKHVPSSFADFIPDKKSKFNGKPPRLQSKSGPPPDWKGYSGDIEASPWMFPSDMMSAALKGQMEEKPTGLLAKLKSEPIAALIAIVLPLTLILSAAMPSIMNFFMYGTMGRPVITTIATGSNGNGNGNGGGDAAPAAPAADAGGDMMMMGRQPKSFDVSYVASILGAIEHFLDAYGSYNNGRDNNKK